MSLLRNVRLAWRFFRSEQPDVVFTSGAAVAVPWVVLGWLFGVPCVYLEVVDRVQQPSLSLRLLEPLVSRVLVHDERQVSFSSKARFVGRRT